MTRRSTGFSLVELMVATAVGGIVTAGAFAMLARARASWAAAQMENRLHERAQYVFATLETELQMAGYFAGARPAAVAETSIPDSAASCGVATNVDFTTNIVRGGVNFKF